MPERRKSVAQQAADFSKNLKRKTRKPRKASAETGEERADEFGEDFEAEERHANDIKIYTSRGVSFANGQGELMATQAK